MNLLDWLRVLDGWRGIAIGAALGLLTYDLSVRARRTYAWEALRMAWWRRRYLAQRRWHQWLHRHDPPQPPVKSDPEAINRAWRKIQQQMILTMEMESPEYAMLEEPGEPSAPRTPEQAP